MDKILITYEKAYTYLNKKGIYELRAIGRGFNLKTPTKLKKLDLIKQIIEVAAGIKPAAERSKRGGPVKESAVSDSEIEKVCSLVGKVQEKVITVRIKVKAENFKKFMRCLLLAKLIMAKYENSNFDYSDGAEKLELIENSK